MTDLPPLLAEALSAIGPEIESWMDDLIEEFGAVPLGDEARLSALAGAVATIAATRYRQHCGIFIAALRGWSLEISLAVTPGPLRGIGGRRDGSGEAQELLLGGIDAILRAMVAAGSAKHYRLVTELAVMARLLGRYDAHSIHLVLTAAGHACEDPTWQSGALVRVSLCESAFPLTRAVDIAALAPCGTA